MRICLPSAAQQEVHIINVFKTVKANVTARQAAEFYGLTVNRRGMACCPFHSDRHPSMKVDSRFHCFACQADGDVIDLTARLFGLPVRDAAVKLAEDFGLPYDGRPESRAEREAAAAALREKRRTEEAARERERRFTRAYREYFHLLRDWEREYAPRTRNEALHPRFCEALSEKDRVEYLLDILQFGSEEEKINLMNGHAEEVQALEQRIAAERDEPDAGASDQRESA